MRRFRIRHARHSVGSLPRALRQTSLLMQRLQRERALAYPAPAGKATGAPNGKGRSAPGGRWRRHIRRDPSAATTKRICFPQVNERPDRSPSKLARQYRHKRGNEAATASVRTRQGYGFANSPRQEPFILSLGDQTNGSLPLNRPKETIIHAALPIRAKYRLNCPFHA